MLTGDLICVYHLLHTQNWLIMFVIIQTSVIIIIFKKFSQCVGKENTLVSHVILNIKCSNLKLWINSSPQNLLITFLPQRNQKVVTFIFNNYSFLIIMCVMSVFIEQWHLLLLQEWPSDQLTNSAWLIRLNYTI